jgi:hypothetical protein
VLVLVFEDLHWADDGLLDFVDYLAEWAGDVPLLVVGTARPELLARRPGWGGGKPNALTLSLSPLSEEDMARLIGSMLGRAVLEAGQQAVLLAQADGNPLYAEQYAQMLAEHGAGQQPLVPETVQGIIAARLDLLALAEKRLLQDAAVIGEVFWPGAVATLGGARGHGELEKCLHGLERKQFVRRERRSSVAGETQYAFAHVLVRDVAYGQIPRAARSVRHAAAAGWIESLGRADDHAEMLAHHYLSALDLARAANRDTADLAPRARAALHAAGDRAVALNAFAAAAGYYQAALALWPQDAYQQRAGLLLLLGAVLCEVGELDRAGTVLSEGADVAVAAAAHTLHARIRVLLADVRMMEGTGWAETLAECEAAAAILQSHGDLAGLAEALTSAGRLRFWLGDTAGSEEVLERAIACARQSGNHRAQMRASHWLAVTFHVLPIPVNDAVARTEQLLQDTSGDPWAEADLLKPLCVLYAYLGRSADARAAIDRSQSMFASFGAKLALAESAIPAGLVGLITADPAAAERYTRQGLETFRAMGERGGYAIDIACLLADARYDQGRFDEAQQMIDEAQADASPDKEGATWLSQAKLLARRGQFTAARQLIDQAQALLTPTSPPAEHIYVLEARAEVERLAGTTSQAAASLHALLRICEDRHATALAERARAALASLAGDTPRSAAAGPLETSA